MSTQPLTSVFGFSVIKGHTDLPHGFNENSNFGFNKDEGGEVTGPIFNFSINDVESRFGECFNMSMPTQIVVGSTLRLYAETSNNSQLKSEDFVIEAEWKKAFKIIEWVILNQSKIVSLTPEDSNNYLNYADERLGAELINDEPNSERIDNYIPKTFGFTPSQASNKSGRISQFTFQVSIKDRAIQFQLYLDADDFCSTNVGEDLFKSVYVFFFEEITHDGKLDNQEFIESIIQPIFNENLVRRYKRYDVFDTAWYKRKNPNDPSQGYETESVVRRFVIFSNFPTKPDSAFPVESRIEAVKNELIQKYGSLGPDGNKVVTDDLIAQYPDLFTRNEVLLLPFGTNNSMTIEGGDVIQGLHPITVLKILNAANRFGFSLQTENNNTSGKSKAEIFFVGGETPNEADTNIFKFPMLAIEKTNKTIYPITSRFPLYYPKYFDQDWPSASTSDQFQFILVRCLGALEGKYTEEQLNSINTQIKFTIDKSETGVIKTISFIFQSARWIINNEMTDDNIR